MAFQQTIIIGNVGREPRMTYTKSGIAVCDFSVAVNRSYKKGEDRIERTTWFRVTCWRELAELASKYVYKGMKVMCIGDIDVNPFSDKNGRPAASLELTAETVQFLSPKPGATGGEPPAVDPIPSGEELPF